MYFRLRHGHPRKQQRRTTIVAAQSPQSGPFISRELGTLFLDQAETGIAQSGHRQAKPRQIASTIQSNFCTGEIVSSIPAPE